MKIKYLKMRIKRKILIMKYNKLSKQNRVVFIKRKDRQLGLSTFLLKEAMNKNYKLVVPNQSVRNYLCKSNMEKFDYNYLKHAIIVWSNENCFRGKRYNVLLDNSFTYKEYMEIMSMNPNIKIHGGFVIK